MYKKDFLPHSDAEFDNWLGNFSTQLSLLGATMGLTAAEVTAIINMITATRADINNVVVKKAELQSIIGNKDMRKILLLKAMRPSIQRMKNHPAYSDDDQGKKLGIVGASVAVDFSSMKPILNVKVTTGKPHLSWNKKIADGVIIYADRNDGHGFTRIATSILRRYVDTQTIPSNQMSVVWSYKIIYFKKDVEVGEFSDVVSVSVYGAGSPGGSSEA
ncbi:MAG: hypothetical protein PHD97_13285 [Bacteroidales bacterium]|nr:hypothetical protein [Bacteroidales bacterium]